MSRMTGLAIVLWALTVQAHAGPEQTEAASPRLESVAKQLPPAQHWIDHLQRDLLPWWRQAAALGQPVGRFPTFRCNDGRAWDEAQPCAELLQAPKWIRDELGRNYVRMQSRQVFAYAMGFHMTGDPELLRWAQAGADDIRARALDKTSGSPATWHENGVAGPAVGERTAQDIAYAGLALASVYYLTRDAALLDDLDRLHRHLMSYYDPVSGQLRWTLTGPERERQELVAQLDPLNAYMVLVTPLIQGERQRRWQADMRRLTRAIRELYCSGPGPRCQGTRGLLDSARAGGRHNDFGHSGKALWMLGLVGQQLHDVELQNWAGQRARQLLQQAWIESSGSWASRWRDEGVEPSKQWWIYAELDQLATTLALEDASYAQYLQHSWPFWQRSLVDQAGHEVWGWVSAAGYAGAGLKQHHWKNGYHSVEHALISYLGSSALRGETATLYFAKAAARTQKLQPYFFSGRVLQRSPADASGVVAVRFSLPQPSLSSPPTFSLPAPLSPLPIKGERRALKAERLPQLIGRWRGEWQTEDGRQRGVCEWIISSLSPERVEALPCLIQPLPPGGQALAGSSAPAPLPMAGPARISDGELHLPGPVLGSVIKAHISEEEESVWLQWRQPAANGSVIVQLRKEGP